MLPNRVCGPRGCSLRPRPAGCFPYFPTGAFTGTDGTFIGGQRRVELGDDTHGCGAGGKGFPTALTSVGTVIAATAIAFSTNPTLFLVMAPAPVFLEATSPLQEYLATGVPRVDVGKSIGCSELPPRSEAR